MEPRKPTTTEKRELIRYLLDAGEDRVAPASDWVRFAAIAVFDDYCTEFMVYHGKVMMVVWGHAPEAFDVFIWRKGRMKCCEPIK